MSATLRYPDLSDTLLTPQLTFDKKSGDQIPKEHYDLLFQNVQSNGCYNSFKQLYEHYYNRLLFFARKYVENMETAEEVISEVFLKLWKKRKEIQINSSFQSYLYTSVRNKCLDHIRKEGNRQYEDDMMIHSLCAEHSNTLDIIHSNELFEKIEKAIAMLPKDRRRIFLKSRNEGMKYKEIAEELGISIKTVETQMGRSLKYLREVFKDELAEHFALV